VGLSIHTTAVYRDFEQVSTTVTSRVGLVQLLVDNLLVLLEAPLEAVSPT
jgi:hypothetical protein